MPRNYGCTIYYICQSLYIVSGRTYKYINDISHKMNSNMYLILNKYYLFKIRIYTFDW